MYKQETEPVLEFYEARGVLEHFPVKKGVQDLARLLKVLGLSEEQAEAEAAKRLE